MQLVLLSGGSGQRLWPLSNSSRSKQFLPLLENEDGSRESMIQRVVRQAKKAAMADEITIATNATQLDIIKNQLGDAVQVVTEPERRDTFPAIALAASYLSLKKGCPDDETVIVMPCDPYTEDAYFSTIAKMAECVREGVADLVLMGITPTYPSTRYGYIVPGKPAAYLSNTTGISGKASTNGIAGNQTVCMVDRFTEKPDEKTAIDLLYQHAMWNGGVFAFKLGYLMDIVRKYVQYPTFKEIRKHYGEFPKISFDYEVAEKAQSVAVVPFTGSWKDLGTWNTLTEELKHSTVGNAIVGPHCKNVHVVNELANPVFVDGISDAVVAASPDGILVCSKADSDGIKDHVKGLVNRPMYEERRWGTYRVVDDEAYPDGSQALTKRITILAGRNSSYHKHLHRTELWTFVKGEGVMVLDGETRPVNAGDMIVVPMGHFHALKANTDISMIEVQIGNPLVEEDVERIEYNWIW